MSPLIELLAAWRDSLPPEGLRDWPMVDHDCGRLQELVRPDSRIVEFGAGASTVTIASSRNRPARWVLVEPDPDWSRHVLGWLARRGLAPPDELTELPAAGLHVPEVSLAVVDGGPDLFSRSLVLAEFLRRIDGARRTGAGKKWFPSLVVDDWSQFCRATMEARGAVAWDRACYLAGS